MRSLLLILATMVLLAGGFFFYFWLQPSTRIARPEKLPKAIPPAISVTGQSSTQPSIEGGEGAWIKHFDDRPPFALTYEFRGKRFQPQKNGTVNVDQPQARFYLDKGQLLTIDGDRGNVVMPGGASPTNLQSSGNQMPSRGQLHDVVISLYPSVDATKATLVCKMNNAAFDNDTFTISTAAYTDASGNEVPADEVKVQVRGDYEFDGKGLTIRWNDRDRHLQLLEIAHGERLLVKDPSAFNRTFGSPTSNPTTNETIAAAPPEPAPTIVPAGEDGNPAPSTPPPAHKRKPAPGEETIPALPKPPRIEPIYRATFNDNVRVFRAIAPTTAPVATADVMHVDFINNDKHKATTQPAPPPPPPTTQSSRRHRPTTHRAATHPAHAPVPTRAPAPQIALATTKPAATKPTTRPKPIFEMNSDESQQPITILWTGKLHVAPIEKLTDPPADSKDAVVRMLGNPVVIDNEGNKIHAALVSFHTGRQDGYIRGSDQNPLVTMRNADGSVIRSPSIDYSNDERVATLHGPSDADIPLPTKPGEPPAMAHAQWTKIAHIHLAPAAADSNKMVIDHAEFEGDVHINRPQQLDLQSQQLALKFDPPAAPSADAIQSSDHPTTEPTRQPDLREMLATGDVRTVLTDDTGKTQKIDCDRLNLATARDANGKIYPHVVHAEGHVHTSDPDQELRAGQLVINLIPSTKPSTEPTTDESDVASTNVELEKLVATDNVRIVTTKGSTAAGDLLTVEGPDGKRRIHLMGQPVASVGDPQSTLEGNNIDFDEATQHVTVNSAGHLHTVQQQQQQAQQREASTQPTTRPIDVTWTQKLEVDGKTNIVDIFGGVTIVSATKDDSTRAQGNHMKLLLADKPTTQPTTHAATAKNGAAFNAFQDKTVKSVLMEENVQVRARQIGAEDITKLALFSQSLNYDMLDKVMWIGQPDHPVPGRMLYQQELISTSTTQPTTQASTRASTQATSVPASAPTTQPSQLAGSDLSNLHGATAFEWQKQFRYDEGNMQARMNGSVRIVHFASSDLTGPSWELDADTVTTDLERHATTEPTTQPQQRMRIRRLVADDNVTYRSEKLNFDAQHIEFDPNTHLLIARGTDRNPAELHEAEGLTSGTFKELRFNTATEELEVRGFEAQIRRVGKITTQPTLPDSP